MSVGVVGVCGWCVVVMCVGVDGVVRVVEVELGMMTNSALLVRTSNSSSETLGN